MLRLREIRTDARMSQSQLAQALGVSRSTIAMWETGSSQPDNDALRAIADKFDVSVDYLLGRTADKQSAATDITEEDVKFALFGGDGEITDEMWKEAMSFIAFIKERERKKKEP